MIRKEYISPIQLTMLIIGYILGSSVVSYPAKGAGRDAWIAHLIAWVLGGVLLFIYVMIAKLNSEKTLMEILKEHFGKILGSIIGVLYIFYFIHIASLTSTLFSSPCSSLLLHPVIKIIIKITKINFFINFPLVLSFISTNIVYHIFNNILLKPNRLLC